MPEREDAAESFPYPEFSDAAENIYSKSETLIKRLEKEKSTEYSLYWHNKRESDIKTAMLFFTADAGMIAGLVAPEKKEKRYLRKLSTVVGGEYGYIELESPPPETCKAFIERCQQAEVLRLIAGEIRAAKR